MRQIASEADVALGNAHYYFPSKGHLIQELYATVLAEQARFAFLPVVLLGGPGLALGLPAALAAATGRAAIWPRFRPAGRGG